MMIKIIQSIDLIETYAYRTRKDLLCKEEEIECINFKKTKILFNFDYITKEDIKVHNAN